MKETTNGGQTKWQNQNVGKRVTQKLLINK